jgi:hypothetical protein
MCVSTYLYNVSKSFQHVTMVVYDLPLKLLRFDSYFINFSNSV